MLFISFTLEFISILIYLHSNHKNGPFNRASNRIEKKACQSIARMAKLVNVAVSEAVGVQSLRVRVSLRARVMSCLLAVISYQ